MAQEVVNSSHEGVAMDINRFTASMYQALCRRRRCCVECLPSRHYGYVRV
jgi:hypothetical protein